MEKLTVDKAQAE